MIQPRRRPPRSGPVPKKSSASWKNSRSRCSKPRCSCSRCAKPSRNSNRLEFAQWDANVPCWEKARDNTVPLRPKSLNSPAAMPWAWQNAFALTTAASNRANGRFSQWKVPKTVKTELLRFLDDLGLGKVNRGKRISPARQLKYLHALRAPLEFFNKPTVRLTLRDIENLERALGSGQLANQFTGKTVCPQHPGGHAHAAEDLPALAAGPGQGGIADRLARHSPSPEDAGFPEGSRGRAALQALPQRRATVPDCRLVRQRRASRGISQHPASRISICPRGKKTSSRSPSSRNTPRRWAGRSRCIGNSRWRP